MWQGNNTSVSAKHST